MEGIGKYKIMEEKDDFDEETLQPSQLHLQDFVDFTTMETCKSLRNNS